MSVAETPPSALGEEANDARPDYWLEHAEGFQVFGPNGRLGFVELVVRPEEGVDGLVIRTGLFRTSTAFVPSHEVGSVVTGSGRLELLTAPRVSRERISHVAPELSALGGVSNSASGETTREGDTRSRAALGERARGERPETIKGTRRAAGAGGADNDHASEHCPVAR